MTDCSGHMGDTRGHFENISLINRPSRNGWQVGVPAFEPGAGALLAVHVAQHDCLALAGQPGGEVGSQGTFTAATFAVDYCDHRHGEQLF